MAEVMHVFPIVIVLLFILAAFCFGRLQMSNVARCYRLGLEDICRQCECECETNPDAVAQTARSTLQRAEDN